MTRIESSRIKVYFTFDIRRPIVHNIALKHVLVRRREYLYGSRIDDSVM